GSRGRGARRAGPSFPTRRSSDLGTEEKAAEGSRGEIGEAKRGHQTIPVTVTVRMATQKKTTTATRERSDRRARPQTPWPEVQPLDRKSTRLNSSHVKSSYAVFCL